MEEADHNGLLAAGGDLSVQRLLLAYRKGIFPWFEGEIPLWWSPDPRFVMFPNDLYISKSMHQVIKKNQFTYTQDADFKNVINNCRITTRPGQQGTWISQSMMNAYHSLFEQGHAHSFEAWQKGQIVGGLYGVRIGNVFFGESMFSTKSNASKAAFIWAVQKLKAEGIQLIDCQVYTQHLQSLGAKHINRKEFLDLLHNNLG